MFFFRFYLHDIRGQYLALGVDLILVSHYNHAASDSMNYNPAGQQATRRQISSSSSFPAAQTIGYELVMCCHCPHSQLMKHI